MSELTQIGQLGVAGLAVYLFWRLASNHIDHNTKVIGDLKDAISKNTEFLGDLKDYLKR